MSSSLLKSRKFWLGAVSLAAVGAASTLRALDKLPAEALLPTILSITGIGMTTILGHSITDAAARRAGLQDHKHAPPAPPQKDVAADETVPATINAVEPATEAKQESEDAPKT